MEWAVWAVWVEWVDSDKHLDHIGIVIRDPETADKIAQALGIIPGPAKVIDDRGIRVVKLNTANTTLELISPVRPDSEVENFLQTRGPGLHHICFSTKDIEQSIRKFKDVGIDMIPNSRRKGAEGRDVVFFHPRDTGGILIELEAENGGNDEDN